MTATDDLTGRTLAGRYEILRSAGEEALGRVWVARDLRTARLVQVKVLPQALAAEHERFVRFARELKASFLVTHPNTVEVLDHGEEAGAHYLVLEYLAAHRLADELAKGPLPVDRAAAIAAQVAHAVGAAHQEGIVHRALSAQNVLLLENADGDYVKVRDFGTSKLDRGEDEPEVTESDMRLGDAATMAPEYVETGTFHPKGDLYALGVLLFQMVAGRLPFLGERDALLEQHVTATPPRLAAVAPHAPEWLDSLVADLLVKKPADRPGVFKIVQRLEAGVGHPLGVPPLRALDPDGRPVPSVEPRPAGLPVRILAIAAVLLVGGVGAIAVLVAAVALVALLLTVPR